GRHRAGGLCLQGRWSHSRKRSKTRCGGAENCGRWDRMHGLTSSNMRALPNCGSFPSGFTAAQVWRPAPEAVVHVQKDNTTMVMAADAGLARRGTEDRTGSASARPPRASRSRIWLLTPCLQRRRRRRWLLAAAAQTSRSGIGDRERSRLSFTSAAANRFETGFLRWVISINSARRQNNGSDSLHGGARAYPRT